MSKKYPALLLAILMIFTLVQPPAALADRGHGHGYGHGYGYGGGRGLAIASLAVGSAALLYSAGLFYRSTPAGYVVVQPAMAPAGYSVTYVNGMPYYYPYPVVAPTTYVAAAPVVQTVQPVQYQYAQPAQVQAPAPAPAQVAAPAPSSEPFEIRLPNGNGSYTSVTLRKTANGFLGPQGEFYADHPSEDELRKRYLNA